MPAKTFLASNLPPASGLRKDDTKKHILYRNTCHTVSQTYSTAHLHCLFRVIVYHIKTGKSTHFLCILLQTATKKIVFFLFILLKKFSQFLLDKIKIIWQNTIVVYRRVAQLGRALRSGRRSRRFKSCHADFKRSAKSRPFSVFSSHCITLPFYDSARFFTKPAFSVFQHRSIPSDIDNPCQS